MCSVKFAVCCVKRTLCIVTLVTVQCALCSVHCISILIKRLVRQSYRVLCSRLQFAVRHAIRCSWLVNRKVLNSVQCSIVQCAVFSVHCSVEEDWRRVGVYWSGSRSEAVRADTDTCASGPAARSASGALSDCHIVKLSQFQTIKMSHCQTVTTSDYHIFKLSHCHTVIQRLQMCERANKVRVKI